ncbi:MAG: DUF2723 domain-containing protein [Chitinophagaceae bacterium]|nr:DUF2723 domain-containing protein [Chitinophagaceae bacterium]
MNFRKVNNLTGWAVFLIAMITYTFSREARGSLWDCGEFVSCAYKMGMPHPPGAPMFTLLGRFFIILFGNNPMSAANAVNFMSAAASAGTILFLFWTITHFARKMFVSVGEDLSSQQIFTVMSAGIVGALAYTFSDSFWYSAVEGEVYALSSFFTALVFWAALKWEHADEHAGNDEAARAKSDKWIVFLFFMMGLSIGVHLLNLLTIPAIVMIYYYRRYQPTLKGSIIAFLIGCAITGIVQVAIIQYSMEAAGWFDVFFVNTLGMPFFSGFAIYFILIAALIAWALTFKPNVSKNKIIIWAAAFFTLAFLPFAFSATAAVFKIILLMVAGAIAGYFIKPVALKVLKLTLWCFAFMMLGYFMYLTSMIRSSANPAIDMNDVDNPINLVYYLSREQYGSAPLVYGPHYAAEVDFGEDGNPYAYGKMKYVQGEKKYIPIGRDREVKYVSSDKQLFPRIWDSSNDQGHAQFYADWLGLDQSRDPNTGQTKYGAPSYGDNLNWFLTYQTSWMYMRYFMWNFAGKQNDIQGFGNKRDGNWISGISVLDNARLGDQSKMPDSIKHNKANNKLYLLPLILGILGFVYQYVRNRKDFIVTGLLFFFTGMAIVMYLNQPGNQPRERDYAYVGSFYAFAIWIGLAVVAFVKFAIEKTDKETFQKVLIYGASATFLVTALSTLNNSFGGIIIPSIIAAIIFMVVFLAVTYLTKALAGKGNNVLMANVSAGVLCLLVPVMMAQQEWDDHDRSQKTLAPDLAKDYLESCAPNAIIFTFGDNDTYPLWYAQEVEGVRPDIRVINQSLLGIDWYINQLRYKVNNADSVDVIWSPEQIEGHNREYIRVTEPQPGQNIDPNAFYPLYDVMKDVLGRPVPDPETGRDSGPLSFPIRKFTIPVDKNLVHSNGTVNDDDVVLDQLNFEIPKGGLQRNDLMILNIIATNKWKRPIYFTAPYGELGFGHFLRKDGLAYRLVPIETKPLEDNWVYEQALKEVRYGTGLGDNNLKVIFDNLFKKYEFGGANKKGTYFDEENRRHLLNIRGIFGEAAGNLADAGKKDEANKLIEKAEKGIDPANLPYGMVSRRSAHNQTGLIYTEAIYKTGNLELARKVAEAVRKDIDQQKKYYSYMQIEKPQYYAGLADGEVQLNEVMGHILDAIVEHYDPLKKDENKVQELQPEVKKAADSAKSKSDSAK